MGVLTGEALLNWVARSCLAQGVPLKVTDVRTVEKIRTLLGGLPGRVSKTGRSTGSPSESPVRLHPVGVERACTGDTSTDDGVVEQGLNDGSLPGKVETSPLSA